MIKTFEQFKNTDTLEEGLFDWKKTLKHSMMARVF